MIRGGKRVMTRSDSRSNRPAIDIADILRRHSDAYRRVHAGHLGRVERRVMSAIVARRTEALGGHVEACDDCGTTRVAYNSCRNRHCPKCQGRARAAWLAAREADLLPVPYFHVVFTLPAPIAAIAFQNKAVVYAILFKAAAEANFLIMSGQRQTMPSRRPWIRPSRPGPRFLPVPIVGASCASSSAFDTAAAAPALEPHRSDATRREPVRALHDDHHSQRLDHRRRGRSRAATPRDDNYSMQRTIDRDCLQNAPCLKLPPMRSQHVSASDTQSAGS